MVYQNPQAAGKLRYGLDVLCNVDDDVILGNVLTNARKVGKWAKSCPAHDRTLLICGSGPSVRDDAQTILNMKAEGADVWALNNCVHFLQSLGLTPDAQVIMDALPETIKAVGPAHSHLFASQVNPSLFDAVPDAILWHATHGNVIVDEQEGFPDHEDAYCLIGSAVSIGNTAMVLAFALGYRNIHLFGYDSSNKGASHVIHQPWNDGEPMTIREFRGKQYECSLTMSLQADAFHSRAAVLIREGCKLTVHGYGLLPDRWNAELSEREKYQEIWRLPEYAEVSPGEQAAAQFVDVVKPQAGCSIGDFGCGSGKGSLALAKLGDFKLTLVDFVDNSRVAEARAFPFIEADLSGSAIQLTVDHGYCTDVLEHIPTALVEQAISNIMRCCGTCFFQISTIDDDFGGAVGQPLHLSVFPHSWWRNKFLSLGYAVLWEQEGQVTASFHIA